MIFQSPRISTLIWTCLCLFHKGYLSSDERFSQRITSCPSKGKQPETYSEKTAEVGPLQRPNAPKETYRKVDWQVNQGAKKLQVALFRKQVLDSECTGSSPKLFSYNRFSRSSQSPGRSDTKCDPATDMLCLFHLPQEKHQGLKR